MRFTKAQLMEALRWIIDQGGVRILGHRAERHGGGMSIDDGGCGCCASVVDVPLSVHDTIKSIYDELGCPNGGQ